MNFLIPGSTGHIKALFQWLLPAVLFFSLQALQAQNINPKFGKEYRKLRINGGLRLMNDFYAFSGILPRRDGFQFRAQARLNLSLLGINAPFTFNFSDGNRNFKLPSYTFTGISPRYKIATLHLGDRSLFFSRYTLGNITFRGAGLELRPGKFYFAGMYGRLRRAVAEDLDSRQNLDPSYKRMGYGLKLGYSGDNSKLSFIFFNANDDENSIGNPALQTITPNSNTVASLQGYQKINDQINLTAEWAHSLFNKDKRALAIEDRAGFMKTYGGLFTPNASFQSGDAFNSQLNYNARGLGLHLGYERITRGFRTLGAIFFNNDLEHLTAGFSKSMFKNKLSLSANAGIERTNLDEFMAEKTSRFVGAANLNYRPSNNWNYALQYSNFQNSTKLRATRDLEFFVDSVFLAQVTQSASFTLTHLLGNEGDNGSLTGLLSFQNANSIIEDVVSADQQSDFWYGSLIYNAARSEDFGWGASFSINRSSFDNNSATYITPSFLIDKSFFDNKLITDARLSLNYVSQISAGSFLFNFGLGASYQMHKDHALRLSSNIIQQFKSDNDLDGFFEAFLNVTYDYRFKK